MNYKILYKHVIKAKNPKRGIAGPRHWDNLLLDEKTGIIYPVSKRVLYNEEKGRQRCNQSSKMFDACLLIRPDNVMVFVGEYKPSHFDLAPYGISGRICSRISPWTEYVYLHDLFDKYEWVPNMEVDLRTGKPVNARRTDKIPVNQKRLAEVRARTKEIKHTMMALLRINDMALNAATTKANNNGRRAALQLVFEGEKDWFASLLPYYKRFYEYANIDETRQSRAFDNMMRFDQAAVYKFTGVVS